MDDKIILGALNKCTSREQIESVFSFSKTEGTERKTKLLLETMGNPEVFFAVGEPSVDQKYEFVLASFLSMSWKFAQMCRRGQIDE